MEHTSPDAVYGDQVFLRHYCLALIGPDRHQGTAFPADRRAACGFNGDMANASASWRAALGDHEWADLARRMARKTLFALTGFGQRS